METKPVGDCDPLRMKQELQVSMDAKSDI